MTKTHAAKLRQEDRRICREERLVGRPERRHIIKQEQRTLNQQENKVGAQIGK